MMLSHMRKEKKKIDSISLQDAWDGKAAIRSGYTNARNFGKEVHVWEHLLPDSLGSYLRLNGDSWRNIVLPHCVITALAGFPLCREI